MIARMTIRVSLVLACSVPTCALAQEDTASVPAIARGVLRPVFELAQTATRLYGWLERHGIQPTVQGQGPYSGIGPSLTLGMVPGAPTVWANLRGGITVHEYWRVEGRLGGAVRLGDVPVSLEAMGRMARRTRDEFFGFGNTSAETDRSDFARDERGAGVTLSVRPFPLLWIGLEGVWDRTTTEAGRNDDLPDVGATFTAAEAPGYDRIYSYLTFMPRAELAAGPHYSRQRRGSWVGAEYRRFFPSGEPGVGFGVAGGDAGAEFPLDSARRSFAVAVYYRTLDATMPDSVPFFYFPALGGHGTLPSYSWYRFRDRHSLLGKVEYRHRVWRPANDAFWVDVVPFVSAGLVGRTLEDLVSNRPRANIGLSVNALASRAGVSVVSVAVGGEGVRLDLLFEPSF